MLYPVITTPAPRTQPIPATAPRPNQRSVSVSIRAQRTKRAQKCWRKYRQMWI